MTSARLVLLCALSLVASPFVGAPSAHAAGRVVAEGPRIRIESGVEVQATADRALAVAEAALELAQARLPYKLPPGEKLYIELHAREEAYSDAIRLAGEGGKATDLSVTLPTSRESHVLVAPRAEPAYLALVDDLPELTRFHVAISTVVQLLHRAQAPSLEWWPAWYVEGLAQTIALDAIAPKSDAPPLVFPGEMLDLLKDASATGRVLSVARLLAADVVAAPVVRRVHAHWIALFRVLGAEPEKLRALHEAVQRLRAPTLPEAGARDFRSLAFGRACTGVLAEIYGPPEALDRKLAEFAAAARPTWFDALRWSQLARDELVCAAPAGSYALAVSEQRGPGAAFSLSFEMYIHDLGTTQGEVYLGYEHRDDPRFVKLAFLASGSVTLLGYSDGVWQDRLKVNVRVDPALLTVGSWIPIRIRVADGLIRVDARDKKLIELPAPAGFELLRGRVGFGSLNELVRFRKIAVEALPTEKPPADGPTPPK